jgi:hypothetical protein
MTTDDYLADYACLGLQPGCSLEALERRWRRAVSELHPDRGGGTDIGARSRQLRELTLAYRRLRSFEREHGRLPGGAPPAGAAVHLAPAMATAIGDNEQHEQESGAFGPAAYPRAPHAGTRGSRGLGLMVLAALGLGWVLGALSGGDLAGDAGADTGLDAAQRAATMASAATGPRGLRLGDSAEEVERLLGPPYLRGVDLWEYGPSHVRFERGRVSGWYSSPMKPLPVDAPVP